MSFDKPGYLIGRGFVYTDYRPQFPRHYGYTVRHVRIRVRVDANDKLINGYAEYTINVTTERGYIEFDAAEMGVKSVRVDGTDAKYEYDGKSLRVYVGSGDHVVSVEYEAKPRKGLYFVMPDEYYRDRVPMVWTQGESEDNHYWMPLPDYNGQASPLLVVGGF